MPAVLSNSITSVHQLELPADLNLVASVRQEFTDFLTILEIPPDEIAGWKLVFTELLNNAILHGADNDPEQKVSLEWCFRNNRICVSVQDPGSGPEPEAFKDSRLPEEQEQTHGRGIFLISTFCDHIQEWRGECGYKIEICKLASSTPGMDPPSEEMQKILDELSVCYEGLAAFYQLNESMMLSNSVGSFIDNSLSRTAESNDFDLLKLYPSPGLPEFVLSELKDRPNIHPRGNLPEGIRELMDSKNEIVWESHTGRIKLGADIESLKAYSSGCLLPVVSGDQIYGMLAAARKSEQRGILSSEVSNLRTFADIYGISIANHISTTIRNEAEKDLREYEIAADIQKHLLPRFKLKQAGGREILLFQEEALQVAGDYVEYFQAPDGSHYLTLIDVMGKGVSAAMLGIIYRATFELLLKKPRELTDIIGSIGNLLRHMLDDLTMFITATILRWRDGETTIEQVNAGHCPTLLLKGDGNLQEFLPSGPPIGLITDYPYQSSSFEMGRGDRVILVTDGCYEWRYQNGFYGWDAFCNFIREGNFATGDELWSDLRALMKSHDDPKVLQDDITLLFLRNPDV